ncbi:type I-A CRISPR-associated protein Cas7/Csa2 [Infirmifilum lucidum]|uniref:Type I-A CRISPR-associated protein Cas7/Csa2 n=1 Tax=Infirmifilum lucidum TaxID=2776706 RepID=A0A7L9FGR0_9CREN|nr:type I-A CRISPR-associated protein Cas7/Csa2 [Infirmifilum lucidum]QOJ78821.1 type I-A CRISPR-associated protein Cas7/Csa2 [Infirmifilum lucidum]
MGVVTFLSVGVRFEANVEALNMVEVSGNYARHRRVPYVITEGGRLKVVYVPAVSGESIAHGYQVALAEEAKALGLPVCSYCSIGEFLKSMDEEHAAEKFDGKVPKLSGRSKKEELVSVVGEIESGIVRKCVVEDVGGFLYAGNPPVKRTSRFMVSYALPIKSVATYATLEPQLHARHARTAGERREGAAEQMIYYVETGTAVYGFTFNLDFAGVGVSSYSGRALVDDVKKRRLAAARALYRVLSSQGFGAKLSRFLPGGGAVAMVATLTERPFTVTSPIYDGFAESTRERLERVKATFGEKGYYFEMGKDGLKTPEDVLSAVIETLKKEGTI